MIGLILFFFVTNIMVFLQWVIASVNSKEENDFINSLAQGSNFWIDGRRTCDGSGNSCWQWSGLNHKNSYYNWAEGEPNNYGGNEDCIEVGWGNNIWNDVRCDVKLEFVCKAIIFIG